MLGLGLKLGDSEGETLSDGTTSPPTVVATIILEAVTTPVVLVTFTSISCPVVGIVKAVEAITWPEPVSVALVMSASGSAVISTNLAASEALVASWDDLYTFVTLAHSVESQRV